MARADGPLLDTGDRFPTLTVETIAHGRFQIDEHFSRGYEVVLIYRGHW